VLDDELAEVTVPQIWAGVDIGKEHHHCVVLDAQGEPLLSRRVLNDATALLELISDVLALSGETLWAVDINRGGAALLIGLLLSHDQPMVYITGLAVHQASTAYRDQGKTDEKDACVIADQARMRKDLGLLRPGDEIAVDLRTLTARRTDLVNDRTRQINRLRAQLLEIFPSARRPSRAPARLRHPAPGAGPAPEGDTSRAAPETPPLRAPCPNTPPQVRPDRVSRGGRSRL
jgi:transposase